MIIRCAAMPTQQNMLFHGTTGIVQVSVRGKPLTFSLDTGAADTDLNEGFAKALPELVKAGQKERPSHSLGSFDGNLGNDILKQATAVTFDFGAMALVLE